MQGPNFDEIDTLFPPREGSLDTQMQLPGMEDPKYRPEKLTVSSLFSSIFDTINKALKNMGIPPQSP